MTDTPKETFEGFLFNVKDSHNDNKVPIPIYVVIDEYDHFANELTSGFNIATNLSKDSKVLS